MPTPLDAFMGGEDLFEEIKAVLSDVSKRPLLEVLSYLVRSEQYSAGIYVLLRNTLPDDYLEDKVWGICGEKASRRGEAQEGCQGAVPRYRV
ncbi:hypothetical protein [Thermococcus thioreducens]|uniref:hypothetical protein n=1 Tax=Thermococcus thioreducens TaxID=277988 RepID=UPI0012FA87D5|nr:hypothetical protein [Thermococcus thioreducens]